MGSEAGYIKERLASLVTPTYPKPRTTCFYGNCAAGKSSLINAALAAAGLSLKSGDGSAGTLVPIEFWAALATQKFPFMARVFWRDLPKCLSIVRTAITDYWMARLAEETETTNGEPGRIDVGKPVLEILMSLFHDKDEFADEDSATQFLSTMKSADDPKVLNKLLRWAGEIWSELSKLGSTAVINAFTADELNGQLEAFTQVSNYPELDGTSLQCSVWPFVSFVKVYMSSLILAKGNVIVHLPGVTDGNALRLQCANQYLRQSDFVIVVANMERGADDADLKEYAMEVCRRKRHGRLAVVLTKSDIIDEDECGRILSLEQRERLASLAEFESHLKERLRSSKKPKRSKGGSAAVEDLDIGLYEYLMRHIAHRRSAILVPARNNAVRPDLQRWYRSKTKDPNELPVFCVSSKLSMEYVKGYNSFEFPKMSLEMTEIPALRSFFLSLAAKSGKVAAFQRHCIGIRLLLTEMELSCIGSKPMMKREHLLKILMKLKMDHNKHFEALKDDFVKGSVADVLAKFDSTKDVWLTEAETLCKKYDNYEPASFLAFINHKGRWQTSKRPKADWNQELLEPLQHEIQSTFGTLCDESCVIFRDEAVQRVTQMIDTLEEEMQNSLDISQSGAFKSFFDSFRDQKQELIHIIIEIVDIMQSRLLKLNNDTFHLGQMSPFSQKMSRIYAQAKKIEPEKKGGAKNLAWKKYFRSLVCHRDRSPYVDVKRYVQDGLMKITDSVEKTLASKCGIVVDAIIRDFDKICPAKDDHSVLTLQRREILGRKVQESKARIEGELKSHLAQCGILLN